MLLKEKRNNVKSVGLTPFTYTSHLTPYSSRLTLYTLPFTLHASRTHAVNRKSLEVKC